MICLMFCSLSLPWDLASNGLDRTRPSPLLDLASGHWRLRSIVDRRSSLSGYDQTPDKVSLGCSHFLYTDPLG
jgi:hypothetical protein